MGRCILKKLLPSDQATRGLLNALGKFDARTPHTVQDVVEVGLRGSSLLGNVCNAHTLGEDAVFEGRVFAAHVPQHSSVSLSAQVIRPDCGPLPTGDHGGMGWLRVENFKKRLREYQDRTGKTQSQAADDLGTTYGTLRFWLSGTRPPKNANLQRAVAVFGHGCSITEFVDDPGESTPGVKPEKWVDASERDRVINSMMFADITAADLSDEEKDELYRAWKETYDRLRRLKAMQPKKE
jgi:transcriptional regulator with XRE-family HTH domain